MSAFQYCFIIVDTLEDHTLAVVFPNNSLSKFSSSSVFTNTVHGGTLLATSTSKAPPGQE